MPDKAAIPVHLDTVQKQRLAATGGHFAVKLEVDSRGCSLSHSPPVPWPLSRPAAGRAWPRNLWKPPCSSPWRVGLAQAAPPPPMWKEAATASAGAAGGKRTAHGQVDGASATRTAGLGVRGSSPEGAPAVSPDMHAALPLGRGVLGMLRRASLRALCSGLFLVLLHWPTFCLCEYLYRRRRGCGFLLLCLPGIFITGCQWCEFWLFQCWMFLYSYKYLQALSWDVSYTETV